MKKTVILCILVAVVFSMISGMIASANAYDRGREEGMAEQKLYDEMRIRDLRNTYEWMLSEDSNNGISNDEKVYMEMIKSIFDSASSVNMNIEANKDGNSKGSIIIEFGGK